MWYQIWTQLGSAAFFCGTLQNSMNGSSGLDTICLHPRWPETTYWSVVPLSLVVGYFNKGPLFRNLTQVLLRVNKEVDENRQNLNVLPFLELWTRKSFENHASQVTHRQLTPPLVYFPLCSQLEASPAIAQNPS